MRLISSTICKTGGREYNQDYLSSSIKDDAACFVVCDGLGGYTGSEVASRLCATKIVSDFDDMHAKNPFAAVSAQMHVEYIRIAHNFVNWHKNKNPDISSSCTTVALVTTDFKTITATHIGDTRIYFFKDNKLACQTRDHSLSQHAVDQGVILQKDIRTHKDQNKLTRVLGSDRLARPDISILPYPFEKGDSLILCSDGFWEYVYEKEMEEDLLASANPAQALVKMEARLLSRAGKFNDNYSAIVAMCVE